MGYDWKPEITRDTSTVPEIPPYKKSCNYKFTKEQPMNEKWEPVDYDDWQVGDELRRIDEDGHGIYIVTEFVKAMMRGYSSQDNPWERKTKEQPMSDGIESTVIRVTDMHNVWDEHGKWRGVQKNTRCFTPGWTYELVPESKYPEMPIEDGVYRVEREHSPYLMEVINGEWHYANGVSYEPDTRKLKIIEKYKRVK